MPDLVTENDVETKGPEAVGLLVRRASLGWNLLYDIGPHDAGDLAAVNVAHLRALAKYMKVNGESVTGAWGGPCQPPWLTTRSWTGAVWEIQVHAQVSQEHVRHWLFNRQGPLNRFGLETLFRNAFLIED